MTEQPLTIEAAMTAARAGDLPRAARAAEAVLARAPKDPNALQILGLVKWREGRNAEALECFLAASRAAPNHPPILNSLGILYRERGDLVASRAALEKAVEVQPNFADALYNLATTLAAIGDEGARACFERAIALNPRHADSLGRYSRYLEARHELEPARAMAARALAVDPHNAPAHMTLADLSARDGDHAGVVARATAALAAPILAAANRSILLGMRAQALEKLGRYSESFADSAAANAIMRAQFAAAYASATGPRTPDTLTRLEDFARAAPLSIWRHTDGFSDPDPVFFVGFPRSGTTMLDQILSTFPAVSVLEEKENIQDAWLELLVAPDGLDRWAALTHADIARLRASYWKRARAHARAGAELVIDKLPLDTALLGLIHLIFPKARIIFALRDPRDAVLSCFQQTFGMNAAMYRFLDLGAAAAYYDQVMRLGVLWREKLPLVVHEVRYERVVADFDAEIRALTAFLGLPWTDDLWKFHEVAKTRAIRTPSAKQVIQPLYSSSVGKWLNYAAELAPALPLINPWTEYFGYAHTTVIRVDTQPMKRLVPHDPLWAQIYENEAKLIADLMGGSACMLHHIGSTAIPNLQAKPIIDILMEAVSLQAVDDCAERLEKCGYEARGEYGIPGRRYFNKKPADATVAFHLHAYLAGSFQIRRHLAFRDFLIMKPDVAAQYAALKADLSFADGTLKPEYQEAKQPFVDHVALEALRYFERKN